MYNNLRDNHLNTEDLFSVISQLKRENSCLKTDLNQINSLLDKYRLFVQTIEQNVKFNYELFGLKTLRDDIQVLNESLDKSLISADNTNESQSNEPKSDQILAESIGDQRVDGNSDQNSEECQQSFEESTETPNTRHYYEMIETNVGSDETQNLDIVTIDLIDDDSQESQEVVDTHINVGKTQRFDQSFDYHNIDEQVLSDELKRTQNSNAINDEIQSEVIEDDIPSDSQISVEDIMSLRETFHQKLQSVIDQTEDNVIEPTLSSEVNQNQGSNVRLNEKLHRIEFICDFERCRKGFLSERAMKIHKSFHFRRNSLPILRNQRTGLQSNIKMNGIEFNSNSIPNEPQNSNNFETKSLSLKETLQRTLQSLRDQTEDNFVEYQYKPIPNSDTNQNHGSDLQSNEESQRNEFNSNSVPNGPQNSHNFVTNSVKSRLRRSGSLAKTLVIKSEFFCDFKRCRRGFGSERALRIHKSTSHLKQKSFICSINDCNKTFKTRTALETHQNRLKKVLRIKGEVFHNGLATTSLTLDGRLAANRDKRGGPYNCSIDDCNKHYRLKASLDRHRRLSHSQRVEVNPWFICHEKGCDFRTKDNREFVQHKRSIHKKWGGYYCRHCDYVSTNNIRFRSHIKTHESPMNPKKKTVVRRKTFSCMMCTKAFMNISSLRRHMTVHRIACEWKGCKRTFSRKYMMKDHMNTHTGQVLHVCHWPKCKKQFMTKTRLNNHVYAVHTAKGRFSCSQCKFQTARIGDYNKHLIRHLKRAKK